MIFDRHAAGRSVGWMLATNNLLEIDLQPSQPSQLTTISRNVIISMEEGEKGKKREGCVSHQLSKVQKRHPEKEPLLVLLVLTQSSE